MNLCPYCKDLMVPQNRTVWCLKCEGKAIQEMIRSHRDYEIVTPPGDEYLLRDDSDMTNEFEAYYS